MRKFTRKHAVFLFSLTGGIFIGSLDLIQSVLWHLPDPQASAFQLGLGFFFGGIMVSALKLKMAREDKPQLIVTLEGLQAIEAFLLSKPDMTRELYERLKEAEGPPWPAQKILSRRST